MSAEEAATVSRIVADLRACLAAVHGLRLRLDG